MFGTFLKVPRPEVVEVLAVAGFDFVICDMEHAQITEAEARLVIQAGRSTGVATLVRLPDPEQGVVNRLLEAGAAGIQLPRYANGGDDRRARAMLRFPPQGVRSAGNAHLAAGYGSVPIDDEYISAANDAVVLVGQFETRAIEEPLEAALQGVDVAFVGLVDLSIDYGVPGQFDHPEVVAHVRRIEETAQRCGIAVGGVFNTAEEAGAAVAAGYRFVALSNDTRLLMDSARRLIDGVR